MTKEKWTEGDIPTTGSPRTADPNWPTSCSRTSCSGAWPRRERRPRRSPPVNASYDFDDLPTFLDARYEGDTVLITETDFYDLFLAASTGVEPK